MKSDFRMVDNGKSNGGVFGSKINRKPQEELKKVRVTVQVSDRERGIIESLARKEGQTVSEYIRCECIWKPYNLLTGGDSID